MGDHSEIQWTDATWNPSTGCTRVSAGCDHCYAFQLHDQRHEAWKAGNFPTAPAQYHKPFSEVQLIPERLTLPLRWTKPRRIFVDSMSDLFHPKVPAEFIAQVFATMAMAPRHTFQVLTKRPQRMKNTLTNPDFWAMVDQACIQAAANNPSERWRLNANVVGVGRLPLPNVWLGTSVENQEAAYRIDWLIKTPAAVRFLSCEPLIGPLDLEQASALPQWDYRPTYDYFQKAHGLPADSPPDLIRPGVDWVIVGGESGPGYRPLDLDWARALRDQCVAAGVPYFFKQVGGIRSKAGGRELDGRVWDEMPAVAS